ncbi:phospholipase [Aureococcus anophagefferens]|nr:phospholipase [Aureococcus anophagefferens]
MSFSDAEGDIAVVEFTILDAHDAAMALSLVRAALALTKHASAVVGVVAVHGERGGTALAYLERSEAAELFARRWDGAALRSEPERAVATARCASRSDWLALHEARARHGAAAEDGEDLAALTDPAGNRGPLTRRPSSRRRARAAAGARAAARRRGAPSAPRPRGRGGAGRARGVRGVPPRLARADFGAGRPFGAAIEAKLGVHAVRHDGSRLHGCRGAAELPQTRELLRHELAPASNLAYDTPAASSSTTSRLRAGPATRTRRPRRRGRGRAPRARRRRGGVGRRARGGGGDAGAALGAARRPRADCRRLAALAAASAADRARADAARRSSLKAPWATALDDVFGPDGSLELNVALAPTRRMKGLDTWRAVRWLGAQHPRRVSLQPPVLFEYYAEALAWGDAGATKAVGRMLLDGGEGEPGRHALLYAPPRARGPASVFCALCRAMERSGDPSEIAASAAGRQKRAKFPTSKAPFSAVFHSFRLTFGRAIISRNGLEASAADYVACFDWVRSVCGRGAFAAALADRGDDAFGGAAVLHALCAATPSTANRRAIAALLRLGADPLAAAGPPAAFGSDADGDDDEAARGGPLFALGVAFESSNDGAAHALVAAVGDARRRGAAGDGGVLGAVVRDALRHAFTNTAMGLHLQLLLASPALERPTLDALRDLHIDAVAGRGDARLDFYTPVIRLVKNAKDMGLRPVEIRPLNYIEYAHASMDVARRLLQREGHSFAASRQDTASPAERRKILQARLALDDDDDWDSDGGDARPGGDAPAPRPDDGDGWDAEPAPKSATRPKKGKKKRHKRKPAAADARPPPPLPAVEMSPVDAAPPPVDVAPPPAPAAVEADAAGGGRAARAVDGRRRGGGAARYGRDELLRSARFRRRRARAARASACSDDWPDACAFAPDSPAASTPPRSPDRAPEEPPDIDGGDDDELPSFAPAEDPARAAGGDDEELPSAAILRGAKVDQLIVYLCRLARRRTGGAPATVRDFGYLEKKEAADVLQKTIFHFWMLYSGPASLVNDPFFPPSVEQMSEHAAARGAAECAAHLLRHCADQIEAFYNRMSREGYTGSADKCDKAWAREAARRLLRKFGDAGVAVRLAGATARRAANNQAPGGRWTDASLGLALRAIDPAPDGAPSRGSTREGAREGRLLARVFCCVHRYETLFRFKGGHLSACPAAAFAALRSGFEVYREAFSSPLNRSFRSCDYFSLFYDVDRFFGSRGSFYAALPPPGSYQANPPYDANSMTRAVEHICATLDAYEHLGPKGATSFVLVLPRYFKNQRSQRRVDALLARWRRHGETMHDALFDCGFQHRPEPNVSGHDFDARGVRWISKCPIQLLWLQNAAGHRRWPPDADRVAAVVAGFSVAANMD